MWTLLVTSVCLIMKLVVFFRNFTYNDSFLCFLLVSYTQDYIDIKSALVSVLDIHYFCCHNKCTRLLDTIFYYVYKAVILCKS